MRYLTCESCRFDPSECELRQRISEQLKIFNAGVPPATRMSSLRFTCPDRLIGFGRGARVVVEEAIVRDTHYGEVCETAEIPGIVMGHLTDKVQIWLDSETSRGKRWIRLRPVPRIGDGSIGVRSTGERGDLRAASLAMIQGIRSRDGSVDGFGLPVSALYWCPDCLEHREQWEIYADLSPGPGEMPECPGCQGKNLEVDIPAADKAEPAEANAHEEQSQENQP